jgi:HK97 family phage major capsid protein/HK97 family phage prohead protease
LTDKELVAVEFKFSGTGTDDAGAFAGLAATWALDRHGDVIDRKAFARTIAEHKAAGTKPSLLWSHDPAEIIGVIETFEATEKGVAITGRLADTQRGREARELAKIGAIGGLSIGFRTTKARTGPNATRIIEDLDWIETSFVGVPANGGAVLTTIKAADAAERADAMSTETKGAAPDLAAIETKIAALADQVKAANDRADALETQLARPAVHTKGATGDDAERKAFVAFARKGRDALTDTELKALRVSSDAAGGFLAPEEFSREIIKGLVEINPIRQYARVMQIGASEVKMAKRTGTTAASWVSEIANRTTSEPTFAQITLTPHELATFTDISNQLLEDAIVDMESELRTDFIEAFGKAEATAFATGTGTGQPEGIWTNADVTQVAGGHASNLTYAGLNALYHALPSYYANRAVFLMNRATMGLCRGIVDGQSRPIWVDNMAAGNPPTIFGRPVVEVVDAPATAANAFPIIFGDLMEGYRITDRIALSVLRDPYSVATNGQTRFHARRRVGGAVVKAEALRKLKIATTV